MASFASRYRKREAGLNGAALEKPDQVMRAIQLGTGHNAEKRTSELFKLLAII